MPLFRLALPNSVARGDNSNAGNTVGLKQLIIIIKDLKPHNILL